MAIGQRGNENLGVFGVLVFGAIALVILSVVLLLGITLVSGMATDMGGSSGPVDLRASPDPITGEPVTFEDTEGPGKILEIYTVRDSTGKAIRLTGSANSYYETDEKVSFGGGQNWSVSTWARVDSDASNNTMTAVSAGGRVLIQYNGTAGNWTAWYYEEGDADSYTVNVSAPNQPGNLSLVTVTRTGDTLTIYRNTTQGESEALNVTNSYEEAELNATNWDGTLDETRVFADGTSATEQSELHSNPVAPQADRPRTARIMFDEGSGSTTAVYFAGTSATLNNHKWVNGLDGHTLESGTDYTINVAAGTITALAGGRIDGAPVVWINYRYLPPIAEVGQNLVGTLVFFSDSSLVIPAAAVLAVLIGGLLGALAFASRGQTGRRGDR